ncbi:MAG: FMN-binding protein [Clostridiales bacterium]|jgi:major membrane immunogen (membrane-anchored lipoprotein)|nr:FMN-binding protein [Clostridiales bacterium]
MKKIICLALAGVLLAAAVLLTACRKEADQLQNGYYTAEVAEFDSHGWKEYVTIYVRENKIVTVEYNAKNPTGFIKSWDMNYMATMAAVAGTYPNEYTRVSAAQLLAGQGEKPIDGISGASHSRKSFRLLALAVIEQAKTGDTSVKHVVVPEDE